MLRLRYGRVVSMLSQATRAGQAQQVSLAQLWCALQAGAHAEGVQGAELGAVGG